MFTITFKMMRKNLRMLIPAGIAILIGTAFIAATFLFGNALNASLGKNATAQYGGANYVVGAENEGDGSALTLKDLNLDALRSIDGVEGVRPDDGAMISLVKGSDSSMSMTVPMEANAADAMLMPVKLSEGEWPAKSGEIAITAETADRLGLGIGDTVAASAQNVFEEAHGTGDADGAGDAGADDTGNTSGTEASENPSDTGERQLTVVGFTTDPDNAYSYYAGASVLPESDFYAMQGLTGHMEEVYVSSVYLLINTDGLSQEQLASTLAQVKQQLPDGFVVQSRADAAAKAIESIGQGQNVMTTFLLVFGIIALLVAALVIANTFQVLVAQRRRTLALLRTIGAKKGQLYRSVLAEATVLGTIASALGVAAAIALMGIMSQFHIDSITGSDLELVVDWRVAVVPLVFGILMTIFASIGSARMATNVTPLEALRPMESTQSKKAGVVRGLLSLAGIIGGLALAGLSVYGVISTSNQSSHPDFTTYLLMAIGGGAVLFLGLILSAVWWMPWLMRGAGAFASSIGPSSKIAAANVQKNPRRVAATGVALLIGVTLVTAISTGAASAKQTLSDTMSGKYSVDVQIEGNNLDEAALKAVSAVRGVEHAGLLDSTNAETRPQGSDSGSDTDSDTGSNTGSDSGQSEALSVGVVGISAQERSDLMRASVGTDSTAGNVVMNEELPDGSKNPYKDGDEVTLDFEDESGKKDSVTLTAVLKDFRPVTLTQITALVDPAVLQGAQLGYQRSSIWVQVKDGTAAVQLISDIEGALTKYPETSVAGPFAEREMWETSIDVVLTVLIGLLAVSVVIALIGVANTLSLSVIERTRESATLRAIGMTKRQLRTSLGVEALIISLVSGIVGVVLGVAFGWLGSTVVLWTIGTVSFRVDWLMCGAVLVIAVLAALVSSIAPARRAVKTAPVVALAEA